MSNIKIDEARLWDSLMTHAKIGGTPDGGICRQALTDEDRAGRDLFCQWCRDAGLEISIDKVGNIFAIRPGLDNTLDPVAFGSHLDTQPTGGKFDGILGVLGGLEVMRALNDANYQTRRPLLVASWTNEEGGRFPPAMLASGVYSGKFSLDYANDLTDSEGVRFGDALKDIGYVGEETVGERTFHSYLELHVEQGPVLEDESTEIGVVNGVQGMSWHKLTVKGRESHAGTTPMPSRLDAMAAANRIISVCYEQANAIVDAKATIGIIEAQPASPNVIPHTVNFTVDLRHPQDTVQQGLVRKMLDATAIESEIGFTISHEEVFRSPALHFDQGCIDIVRKVATDLGYSHRDIVSGAGHDAVYVSDVCPTGMIFVPCEDGISHNSIESITPAQARAGVEILLGAAIRLAE
ncbi:MAG: Zn-dependent hydrolase [Magnetovibrio sp.]|nr:Zn-dependent hydrolase [Magnetovibrio sp.]